MTELDRKAHVEALRRERQHVIDTYADSARVAQIDAELARFDEKPATSRRETAVPGRTTRRN